MKKISIYTLLVLLLTFVPTFTAHSHFGTVEKYVEISAAGGNFPGN